MSQKTKCKVDFKVNEGKMVMTLKGKCDPKHPNREINQETEVNFPDMDRLTDEKTS